MWKQISLDALDITFSLVHTTFLSALKKSSRKFEDQLSEGVIIIPFKWL